MGTVLTVSRVEACRSRRLIQDSHARIAAAQEGLHHARQTLARQHYRKIVCAWPQPPRYPLFSHLGLTHDNRARIFWRTPPCDSALSGSSSPSPLPSLWRRSPLRRNIRERSTASASYSQAHLHVPLRPYPFLRLPLLSIYILDSGVFCLLTLVDTKSASRREDNHSIWQLPGRPSPAGYAHVRSGVDAPHRPANACVP
jgi:hypothetical protein